MKKFIFGCAVAFVFAGGVVHAAEFDISITSSGLVPVGFEVMAGDTVTWTNNDTLIHRIDAEYYPLVFTPDTAAEPSWDSGSLQPGESYSFSFSTSGGYLFGEYPVASPYQGLIMVYSEASTLAGYVYDPSCQVVSDAQVSIFRTDIFGEVIETAGLTGADGRYSINILIDAFYDGFSVSPPDSRTDLMTTPAGLQISVSSGGIEVDLPLYGSDGTEPSPDCWQTYNPIPDFDADPDADFDFDLDPDPNSEPVPPPAEPTNLPDVCLLGYGALRDLTAGDAVDFQFTVRNCGKITTLDVDVIMRVRIDIDGDGSWDVSLSEKLTSFSDFNWHSVTMDWIGAWTGVEGTHVIEYCADATDLIVEDDEVNNCQLVVFAVLPLPTPPAEVSEDITPEVTSVSAGDLVRVAGEDAVYVVQEDELWLVPNPETFMARGYDWADVKEVETMVVQNLARTTTFLPEGALIRAFKSPDVYIIKYVEERQYKRLILNPTVFESYGHLRWENVIDVAQEVVDAFTTSNLVRVSGGTQIYKLGPTGDSGNRQPLGDSMIISLGLDSDSIYEINATERDSYALDESN